MRHRAAFAMLLCLPVAVAVVTIDAGARRSARRADEPTIAAVAAALPGADLSMAGGSRHLRFPSLEDPGAAFADGPASLDAEPGGGAVAPPVEVFRDIARAGGAR